MQPIINMDPQQQLIVSLKNEVKMLKEEISFLRAQMGGVSPKALPSDGTSHSLSSASGKSIKQARQQVQARLTSSGAKFGQ